MDNSGSELDEEAYPDAATQMEHSARRTMEDAYRRADAKMPVTLGIGSFLGLVCIACTIFFQKTWMLLPSVIVFKLGLILIWWPYIHARAKWKETELRKVTIQLRRERRFSSPEIASGKEEP